MAAQAIWNGTISFSLVAIPVRLMKAIQPETVPFHLLHSKDYSRLSRKMFCPAEETMVPREEIVKGYEVVPGAYVMVTDEELESLAPERSRTVEIIEFVAMKEIDPVYYDRPYYLVPSKGGEKAYELLVKVMGEAHTGGLAKFVLAEREYLVVVFSKDNALALSTLHYSEEVLAEEAFFVKQSKREDTDEEKRMQKTIESMIAGFKPEKYEDERMKMIRTYLASKAQEKNIVEAPAVEEEEEEAPADLVSALEESLQKMKANR